MEHGLNPDLSLRLVRHSRMLLAGIQAEFGLDPRLKHSGVTVLGSRISSRHPQFSKEFVTQNKYSVQE
jgi:hypothetical protein